MGIWKFLSLASLTLVAASTPVLAATVVSSPANGAQVTSPFNLTTYSDSCSSLPVAYVGFSLDDSTNTPIFRGQVMNGPITSPSGWHTVHVKAWNTAGGICTTNVAVLVVTGATSVIPSNAVRINNIQALSNWIQIHDGGTPGGSNGWTGTQGWPSLTGWAREFSTSFTYFGGQRYSAQIDTDTTSTNFFYDGWVYVAGSSAGFSNLEFDLNQTMSNGETVVMGFQCDSWINRWDYSVNGGSPTAFYDTWLHSNQPCNARNWSTNTWHHVQIHYSHDYSGWVTYHTVWLDGYRQDINATVFSGYILGWGPAVVTNFQIDGASSGTTSAQIYLDNVNVYRW